MLLMVMMVITICRAWIWTCCNSMHIALLLPGKSHTFSGLPLCCYHMSGVCLHILRWPFQMPGRKYSKKWDWSQHFDVQLVRYHHQNNSVMIHPYLYEDNLFVTLSQPYVDCIRMTLTAVPRQQSWWSEVTYCFMWHHRTEEPPMKGHSDERTHSLKATPS